jgi:hypothetical protein
MVRLQINKPRSRAGSLAADAALPAAFIIDTSGHSGEEMLTLAAEAAAAVVGATAQESAEVAGLTPGVLSLEKALPHLPGLPSPFALPPAAASAAQKLFPKLPTPSVVVTEVDGNVAATAVRAGSALPRSPPTSARSSGGGSGGSGSAAGAAFDSNPPSPSALPAPSPAPPAEGRALDAPLRLPLASASYLCAHPGAAPLGSAPMDPRRRVLDVRLDVSCTPLCGAWMPGDALAVLAPNPAPVVEGVLRALGVAGGARVDVRGAGAPPPPLSAPPAALYADAAAAPRPLFFPPWLPGFPFPAVRDVLMWCVELGAPPKKALLVLLGDAAGEQGGGGGGAARDALFFLAGRGGGGAAAWAGVVEGQALTLLDLLLLFPSARPPLGALLSLLPPLAPRFYSIASSPLATPHALRLLFNVAEFEAGWPGAGGRGEGGRIRRAGLATPWMEALAAPLLRGCGSSGSGGAPALLAFLKPARAFAPPPSLATPLVMVAHGTGLAPFLGFLAHRAARAAAASRAAAAVARGVWRPGVHLEGLVDDWEGGGAEAPGPSALFFGNRAPQCDFYCQGELEAALAGGALTALHCAWSRGAGGKTYVQALLRGGGGGAPPLGAGASLAELLVARGGALYVCGTNAMAAEARAAVVAAVAEHGPAVGLAGGAEEFVAGLQKAGRYGEDKWG